MIVETPLTSTMGIVLSGAKGELSLAEPDMITDHLKRSGAVVLRGFEATLEEFEEFTKELSRDFLVHHDLAREFISGDGTTQSVVPGTEFLPAHVERGYAAPIPGTIFFYCNRPAAALGETTLYDGYDLFDALGESTKRYFRENKLRYKLRAKPELWQRTLMTDDHAEALYFVDQHLNAAADKSRGEYVSCRVDGDVLEMDFVTPGLRRTPRREGEAFSNSSLTFLRSLQVAEEGVLALAKIDLRTEDDREFPMEILEETLAAAESVVVKVGWNPGDFACLDNRTVLHGRTSFTDRERSVFVRIGFGTV